MKEEAKQEQAPREGEGKKRTSCPSCGSSKLVRDYEHGELVCAGCGYVIAERIMDLGPEWRAFDQEQRDKRGRVGAPMTFTIHDKGLSTMIDWRDRDSYGKDLTPKRRAQIYRLRKWQRRIRVSDAIERNLAFALSEIDRMASHLSLPRNVRETAALIYRRAVEEKLIRGRSIEGVAGAALYAACRECKVPRTLDEIAEVSRVSKKEISRSYRFIARELLIHLHRRLRAQVRQRARSQRGGPVQGHRDPEGGRGKGANLGEGSHGSDGRRHLHRRPDAGGEEDAEGGGGRGQGHGGHGQEQVQGALREAGPQLREAGLRRGCGPSV
jgi:transcription initiation factor TFIIIB Brf1 subunit/transcription initiation factor TFIIB